MIRHCSQARLKALAAPENPWRALAEEQLALLDLRLGKTDQARSVVAPSGAGRHGAEWRSRTGERPAEPAGRLTGMARLTRRSALLAPLALGGCGLWDDWFGTHKTPLPGKREAISTERGTLKVDEGAPKVVLPPAVQ